MNVYFTIEVAIFFILFWLLVSPILLFIPWYQWWNKYDPQRQYNCFSLYLLAYYRSNALTYKVMNLISTSENKNMQYDWWPLFLGYIMDGQAIGIVDTPGNPGLCTPQTLCDTLVPTDYPPAPLPKIGRRWPVTQAEWKGLLANWAGFDHIPATSNDYLNGANVSTWQNSPGNFLSKWGIPVNSPAVVAYVTNSYNYNNIILDSQALLPLLGFRVSGSEGVGGGWWGYLQGISKESISLDDSLNIIWTSIVSQKVVQKATDNRPKCGTGGILAGAANFGLMGAAMGAADTGPLAPVGALGGFLIGAIIGAFTGALAQPGCIVGT